MRSVAVAIGLLLATPAYAQKIPPIFVDSYSDKETHKACQVSHDATKDAVRAALRYNGVPAGTSDQYIAETALGIVVGVLPLELSGVCAVKYDLRLQEWKRVFSAIEKKSLLAEVTYCTRGGVLSGPTYDLQSRLSATMKDLVDACISGYEELVAKGR